MTNKKEAAILELIAGLMGWVWIISFITTPLFIVRYFIWDSSGYYIFISLFVGWYCGKLAREYKKSSIEAMLRDQYTL